MINIVSIEILGKSERGDFGGVLRFSPGLQVISGPNSFGKSLAVESIAWCLERSTRLTRGLSGFVRPHWIVSFAPGLENSRNVRARYS